MRGKKHLTVNRGRSVPAMNPLDADREARASRVTITARCECGDEKVFDLDAESAVAWYRGALLQDVFPDMSPDDAERLISGTCSPCWERLFAEEG